MRHVSIFVAIVWLSVVAIPASSQQPTPGERIPGQPQQSHPESTGQRGGPNQQTTTPSPVIIHVQAAPKTEAEADEERRERKEKAELDRRLVDLTGELAWFTAGLFAATVALVLATAILGFFGFRQSQDMRKQIAVGEKTADAAMKSSQVVAGVERPILYVKPEIVLTEGGGAKAKFTIINLGRTPAILEYGTYALGNYATLPTDGVSHKHFPRIEQYTVLYEKEESQAFEFNTRGAEGQPFQKRTARLFVRLFYADIFGVVREAGFCFGWARRRAQFLTSALRRVGGEKYNYERTYRE